MVYKKITMIGTSDEGFEAAVDDAVDRAEETLDDLKWATTESLGVELADGREYQAEVEIAFELDE